MQRSDSKETDKGNPMQDKILTNLDNLDGIMNNQFVGTTTFVNMRLDSPSASMHNEVPYQPLLLNNPQEVAFEE